MNLNHYHKSTCCGGNRSDTYILPYSVDIPEYLSRDNFLGEFRSELDKAKVRSNLGISDDFTQVWGNIKGLIEHLLDLMDFINGKYTDLNNKIITLSNQIGGNPYLEDIQLLHDAISENTLNINALQQIVNQLIQEVNALKPLEPINVLTGIRLSRNYINVTEGASNLNIIVYALYSATPEENITNIVNCSSSNSLVATWFNNTIKIVGVGNAILTFTHLDKSATLNVTVTQAVAKPKLYIGFADDYNTIINDNKAFNTLNGIWNSSNIPNYYASGNSRFVCWAVSTENITSIAEGLFEYDLNSIWKTNITINGVNYTVYKLSTTRDTSGEIKITTNG